jgi:hypothetical protein
VIAGSPPIIAAHPVNSSAKLPSGNLRSKEIIDLMFRRTILRFARPTTMLAIIESIAARTNERQGPDLPQVTTLKPIVAQGKKVPIYAEVPPDGAIGLIYCDGACPAGPPGEPPLVVGFRPLPGHGQEHNGVFSGVIVVYIWQHEGYPLSLEEVQWSIARDCGCEKHEWLQLATCWEKMNEIVHDDLQALVKLYEAGQAAQCSYRTARPVTDPAESQENDPAAAAMNSAGADRCGAHSAKKPKRRRKTDPSHRGTRKPRKASSLYLMDKMRPLDNLYDVEHLFPGYCHVYEASEGQLPANPRASFDQAVESCAERILHERGQR